MAATDIYIQAPPMPTADEVALVLRLGRSKTDELARRFMATDGNADSRLSELVDGDQAYVLRTLTKLELAAALRNQLQRRQPPASSCSPTRMGRRCWQRQTGDWQVCRTSVFRSSSSTRPQPDRGAGACSVADFGLRAHGMPTNPSILDNTRQHRTDVVAANSLFSGTIQHGATRAGRIWSDLPARDVSTSIEPAVGRIRCA